MFGCDKWEHMVSAISIGNRASNVGDYGYVFVKV
jgi:hypothetical protein